MHRYEEQHSSADTAAVIKLKISKLCTFWICSIVPRTTAFTMEQQPSHTQGYSHGSNHNESHGERLYKYTFDEGRQEPRFLIFRGLQLMNIFNLQNELAKLKHGIMTTKNATPEQTKALTKVLHDYSESKARYILRKEVTD